MIFKNKKINYLNMSEKPTLNDKNKIIKDCFKQENHEKADCKEIFANMKVQKEKLESIFKDYTWRTWF
jgi:hypothetical protein